jgi:CheY-like chemotaxis protein
VQQVLMNLCLNARDAMTEGGTLRLETANAWRGGAAPGQYVRLAVRDSGVGMDSATLARVFEPFFTTKGPGEGTGLGLAMVYGIVRQHGGFIEVQSEPGRGTTFEVYLPRAGSAEVRSAATVTVRPRSGTETVLLADDEPMVRNLARAILEGYGYRVLLAGDGREAVDLYARERAGIDLVVLDLTMPQMSGTDAARELLQLNPRVRVLLSSGYAGDHLSMDAVAGVYGFVAKPYRPDDLAAAVRAALDQREVKQRDKESQSA